MNADADEVRLEVFGADEQTEEPVDVMRWIRLARLVLEEQRVGGESELSLIFVDERTISDLNERFLGEQGATDVLAFPMDDDVVLGGRQPDQGGRGPGASSEPTDAPLLLGDVVVCPRIARRQAEARGHGTDEEIALLVVHGVLHLLDFDHAEEEDALVMQRRERELLEKFRHLEGEQ